MKTIIALVGLVLVVAAESARAELPSRAYDELKAAATDVLTVKITKVEIKKDEKRDFQDVIYTAQVFKVDRSKSGRKVGGTIQIASYRLRPGIDDFAGPRIPPLLDVGWKGTAYLKPAKGDGAHPLAAYGESFVTDAKK